MVNSSAGCSCQYAGKLRGCAVCFERSAFIRIFFLIVVSALIVKLGWDYL